MRLRCWWLRLLLVFGVRLVMLCGENLLWFVWSCRLRLNVYERDRWWLSRCWLMCVVWLISCIWILNRRMRFWMWCRFFLRWNGVIMLWFRYVFKSFLYSWIRYGFSSNGNRMVLVLIWLKFGRWLILFRSGLLL